MNTHIVRHTAQCVVDWGPLWCYSCFPLEGMNAKLKAFFHGSRNMNKQVLLATFTCLVESHPLRLQLAFSYIMAQTLPALAIDSGAPVNMLEKKQ